MGLTIKPRRPKNFISLVSAASVTLILASGCVVSPDEAAQTEEGSLPEPQSSSSSSASPEIEEAVASTINSSTDIGHELQIDVHALERLENGILRLQIGVINNSSKKFNLYDGLSEVGDEQTASRISLLDTKNQQRYISYDQSNGSCFCSSPHTGGIAIGETAEMWVVFPQPPDDVEFMTLTTPLTPPLLDVPITLSSESLENEGLAEPEILDLTIISDNVEDQTGRSESGDEVSIILSSDVLFESNSSDLSSNAQEILEQVSTEIDDASSSTVAIDGYADNTGSDSINLPLSQERADSVESILAEIISRSGVTFEAQGHGASDPIADNDTEEGRERNRRVSVTFEK